jgi:hypothetical protein
MPTPQSLPSASPPETQTSADAKKIAVAARDANNLTGLFLTINNWAQRVYEAFGLRFPEATGEIALLGMRESSRGSKEEEFVRETRNSSMHTDPTTYNDILFCVGTENSLEQSSFADVFPCSLDAGDHEISTVGIAIQCEGIPYRCRPGTHKPKKYKGPEGTVLHVSNNGDDASITLAREAQFAYRTFESVGSALVMPSDRVKPDLKTKRWEFCAENQGDVGIHIHFASEAATVGNWSTGCTALKAPYKSERYEAFRSRFESSKNRNSIPYLVVSSEYVLLPNEWSAAILNGSFIYDDPRVVIRWNQLRKCPVSQGRYLSALARSEFSESVLNFLIAAEYFEKNIQSTMIAASSRLEGICRAEDGNSNDATSMQDANYDSKLFESIKIIATVVSRYRDQIRALNQKEVAWAEKILTGLDILISVSNASSASQLRDLGFTPPILHELLSFILLEIASVSQALKSSLFKISFALAVK